jgi:hypothetical protein
MIRPPWRVGTSSRRNIDRRVWRIMLAVHVHRHRIDPAGTAEERRMEKSGLTSQRCHDNDDEGCPMGRWVEGWPITSGAPVVWRAWSHHARGHGGRRGGMCHLPPRTRASIRTKRAQTARFAGRTCGSQAGGLGSQVYISRHSHHACAEICTVRRHRARCSRAPTRSSSMPNSIWLASGQVNCSTSCSYTRPWGEGGRLTSPRRARPLLRPPW